MMLLRRKGLSISRQPLYHKAERKAIIERQGKVVYNWCTVFEINVSDYSTEVLTKAMHIDELVKNGAVNVRIDYRNSGVGSHSCGPDMWEKYRLSEKEISFAFRIK